MGDEVLDPARVCDLAFPPDESDLPYGERWLERQVAEYERVRRAREQLGVDADPADVITAAT